jgi:methylated-DNA-[protein]-cysteine S-methyltransferase
LEFNLTLAETWRVHLPRGGAVNVRVKACPRVLTAQDTVIGSSPAGKQPVRLTVDRLPTPIGDVLIVCSPGALCAVDFEDFGPRMHAFLTRRFGRFDLVNEPDPLGVTGMLARYFEGDPAGVEGLRVDPGGTPYQRRVWQALRGIPYGQTRTYGQIAALLAGTHARAVGHANSLNPVAIVVPCHRVIGANSALTGYAGGLDRKRWLLDHEAREATIPLPF